MPRFIVVVLDGTLQKHADVAALLIRFGLQFGEPLFGSIQVAGGDVTVEFDMDGEADGLREPLHDRLGEPVAGFLFQLHGEIGPFGFLIRAVREGGAGAFNLKVSKVGGLTKAKLMRDLGQELGLQITIEDTWGGDIVSATSAHLAASTRENALLSVSFMNDWTNEHVAGYQPRSSNGFGQAPSGPGLGVEVDASVLGRPMFSVSA